MSKRWCQKCGRYVSLNKYTQSTTKSIQRKCDDCLEAKKNE